MSLENEIDKLYLEKCQEVNQLTEELRKIKEAQEGDLISRIEAIKAVGAAHSEILDFPYKGVKTRSEIMELLAKIGESAVRLLSDIPAVSGVTAAERLHKEVEERYKELAEMAAEPLRPCEGELERMVTAQEILCLSSALRNLYEIHKCDGWLLYNKLSKTLDRAVDEYSRELGGVE